MGVPRPRLLADTAKLMRRYVDAPAAHIIGFAYGLSSCLFGKYVNIIEMQGGGANLYVILAGPPGVTRRGTCLRMTTTLLKKAHNVATNQDDFDEHVMQSFTVEGFADHVNELVASKGMIDFFTLSPEFGTMLASAAKPGSYHFGMIPMWCQVYYGEPWIQDLSQRRDKNGRREVPDGLYYSIIGVTQEVENYMTRFMIDQGLVRRLLMVPLRREDLRGNSNYRPLIDYTRTTASDALEDFAEKRLAPRAIELCALQEETAKKGYRDSRVRVLLHPRATNMVNEYDKILHDAYINSPKSEPYLEQAFFSRSEILVKLAVNNAISRRELKVQRSKDDVIILVQPDDVLDAKKYLDALQPYQERAIMAIVEKERAEKTIPSSKYDLDQMIGVAQLNGGLCTVTLVQDTLSLSDRNAIMRVLGLGVSQGKFEVATKTNPNTNEEEQGALKDGEYHRFKPKGGGHYPQVFRLRTS